MALRHSTILRHFIILLFAFELLTPAFLTPPKGLQVDGVSVAASSQTVDLLSHLVFEEVSNEESREDKEYGFDVLWFVGLFHTQQKFESKKIARVVSKRCVDTQPSLFTLHRALLI